VEVNIWIALIAGLVSFLSPCVLPLVPAYIGYMGGRVTNTVAAQTSAGALVQPTAVSRISTILHGTMFVLGFTFVFVIFGLLTTAFIRQVGGSNIALVREIIGRVGGVVIVFFGLHFMGVLPALLRRLAASPLIASPPFTLSALALAGGLLLWALTDWLIALPAAALLGLWMFVSGGFSAPRRFWEQTFDRLQSALYADTRRQMVARGEQSYASSALMGVVFAAGWTPCIGPIYGSILTLAATSAEIGSAAGQMIAYSLGLGIPFLITAALLDGAQVGLRKLQRHLRKIELVSGAFLVIIGLLVASGRLQQLSQTFASQFADFSYTLEECAAAWTRGEIGLGEIGGCLEQRSRLAAPAQQSGTLSPEQIEGLLNDPLIVLL
jgi:cytochrome c-type biogenesis protein